jgi:hypothetical protein
MSPTQNSCFKLNVLKKTYFQVVVEKLGKLSSLSKEQQRQEIVCKMPLSRLKILGENLGDISEKLGDIFFQPSGNTDHLRGQFLTTLGLIMLT